MPTNFNFAPTLIKERMVAATLCSLFMILALAIAQPAKAENDDAIGNDIVVLTSSKEAWVETDTPKVVVSINAAFEEKGAAGVRKDILTALQKLVKADWRLTHMNRNRGNAGLERWTVTAEARIPDAKATGLYGRAKAVSRTGLQLHINQISYEPSRAELEAAQAKLRATLYTEALKERDRLNAAIPGRNWRIGVVDFTNSVPVAPIRHKARGEMAYAAVADVMPQGGGGLSISKRQVVTARLVLMSTGD